MGMGDSRHRWEVTPAPESDNHDGLSHLVHEQRTDDSRAFFEGRGQSPIEYQLHRRGANLNGGFSG